MRWCYERKSKKIINQWDPIDLFPYSPKDEYEDEINMISKLLNETIDVEHLAQHINSIFIKSFGDDVFTRGYSECLNIAKKILNNEE